MLQPPEKLFVGDNLAHIAKYDRDRRMTLIYTLEHFAYVKHFSYGGVIMDKEYRCAPAGAKALLLTDQPAPEVYVKYAPAKGQKIHQQVFRLDQLAVKSVKAQGNRMTAKTIARLSTVKPRWWDEEAGAPAGVLL